MGFTTVLARLFGCFLILSLWATHYAHGPASHPHLFLFGPFVSKPPHPSTRRAVSLISLFFFHARAHTHLFVFITIIVSGRLVHKYTLVTQFGFSPYPPSHAIQSRLLSSSLACNPPSSSSSSSSLSPSLLLLGAVERPEDRAQEDGALLRLDRHLLL